MERRSTARVQALLEPGVVLITARVLRQIAGLLSSSLLASAMVAVTISGSVAKVNLVSRCDELYETGQP
jgi:hypothetical protein